MSQELVIRKESRPERCDICHHSDLFNPENGYCQRCNTFTLSDFRLQSKVVPQQEIPSSLSVVAMFLGIITIIPGVCLAPVGLFAGIAGLVVSRIEYKRISIGVSPKSSQFLVQVGFWSSLIGMAICTAILISLLFVAIFT